MRYICRVSFLTQSAAIWTQLNVSLRNRRLLIRLSFNKTQSLAEIFEKIEKFDGDEHLSKPEEDPENRTVNDKGSSDEEVVCL